MSDIRERIDALVAALGNEGPPDWNAGAILVLSDAKAEIERLRSEVFMLTHTTGMSFREIKQGIKNGPSV